MREYQVYKLESPSGRCYIGFTGQTLPERFRQHVVRAMKGYTHPLASAIRKYGAGSFALTTVSLHSSREDALAAEVINIAQYPNGYNLSPGGNDGECGRVRLAALLKDPDYYREYCARLSEGCRTSQLHATRWPRLTALAIEWRESNAREAYKMQSRATRCARRVTVGAPSRNLGVKHSPTALDKMRKSSRDYWDSAPPSVRKRKSITTKKTVTEVWAKRTPEEVAKISAKIAATLKAHNAKMTPDELAARNAKLAATRLSIDHTVRKANQKEALARYWTPERRAEKSAKAKVAYQEKKKAGL